MQGPRYCGPGAQSVAILGALNALLLLSLCLSLAMDLWAAADMGQEKDVSPFPAASSESGSQSQRGLSLLSPLQSAHKSATPRQASTHLGLSPTPSGMGEQKG